VKLKHFDKKKPGTYRLFTKQLWLTTTDKAGQYSVDVTGVGPQPSHYCFGVEMADKAGCAQGRSGSWPSVKEVAAGKEIRTIELLKARRITANIVSASHQPIGGFVRATAVKASGGSWSSSGTAIAADGRLEIDIPLNSKSVCVIYCEDHAPKIVSLDADQSDLGLIQLSSGTIVSGQVFDLHNKPASGVVVQLDFDDHTLDGIITGWSRVALTDAEGKFSLQPASGDCGLSVLQEGFSSNKIGRRESIVGQTPPVIAPVAVTLPAERGIHEIVLREAETYQITGTARWEDGTAARGCAIEGNVYVDHVGGKIKTVVTDENGHYEIRLPRGCEVLLSGSYGAYRDEDRNTWYRGYASAAAPAVSDRTYITVEKLESDISKADWEYRVYRAAPPRTKAQIDAEREFNKLQNEDRKLTAQRRGRPVQDRGTADVHDATVAKYLAFEEAYRGEQQAMKAIVHVLQAADARTDPESELATARIELVDRLISVYLGHEDLADSFRGLRSGPEIPRADDLLRIAYARSPHPSVRAAALFGRAELVWDQLRELWKLQELEQTVDRMKNVVPVDGSREGLRRFDQSVIAMRRKLARLKAIDPAELRRTAAGWLKIIEQEYADLERPIWSNHAFGQDAKALRFAIENVIVGQSAPPFEAIDITARPFRLFEHLGEVVVISFNQMHSGFSSSTPVQGLTEEFQGQDFEQVTIVATDSQEDFRKTARTMTDHGTLIWEPYRGAYQSQWGVTRFPTTFIVDRSGKLHIAPSWPTEIADVVKELLKEGFHDTAMEAYRLKPDENVRRVAPPFPTGRMEYYRRAHPRQAESMPDGPGTMYFQWKNDRREVNGMSFGGVAVGERTGMLLTRICGVGPQDLRGDKDLLARSVPGDFIVRADASRDEILDDVRKILSSAWDTQVELTFAETEEDVYVARGKFELSDIAKERGLVIIEGTIQGGGAPTIEKVLEQRQGAMRPPFDYFVTTSVAREIGFPVINEVDNPPDVRVFYSFLGSPPEELSKLRAGSSGGMFMPAEPILKSVSEQTGLTFTNEKRKVTTLTLQRAK